MLYPGSLTPETIYLPHKPHSPLSYRLVPGEGPQAFSHLIVFLNGLILTQDSWVGTLQELDRIWTEKMIDYDVNHPPLLSYDRYGQGASARDPADDASDDGTHDIREVVSDLYKFVHHFYHKKILPSSQSQDTARSEDMPRLILVAHSIGCVIARLFAATFPRVVHGLLLLDSNIANSDLVSIFPDPDAPDFDPKDLPDDVTVAELRRVREEYRARFHPSVPNPEHLDRRNIATLLPAADAPKLVAFGDGGPALTVVEHDWDYFAQECLDGSMRVPKSLTNKYMNPAWRKYHEGLVHITEPSKAWGPVTATECGHNIQTRLDIMVAFMTDDLLSRVRDWKT